MSCVISERKISRRTCICIQLYSEERKYIDTPLAANEADTVVTMGL